MKLYYAKSISTPFYPCGLFMSGGFHTLEEALKWASKYDYYKIYLGSDLVIDKSGGF